MSLLFVLNNQIAYVFKSVKPETYKLGLTFRTELGTSWVCRCTDANTTKLLGTWWTSLWRHLRSAAAVINYPCHATVTAHTTVERLLLLARPSGTHCLKTFGIRTVLRTLADSGSCSRSTSVGLSGALEVVYDNALYKFAFEI